MDGVTETAKDKIKKKLEREFVGSLLAPLVTSLVQPVIFSLIKLKCIREKELEKQEEDVWIIFFSFAPYFKQYRNYQLLQLWT